MRIEAIVDVIRRDLAVLLLLLRPEVVLELLLVLRHHPNMLLQALHERIAERRVVAARDAALLGLLPHLEHEREQHLVVRLLARRVRGRLVGRGLRLEPLGEGGERGGAGGGDGGQDVGEAGLEDGVAGDVGLELRDAHLAGLALFVDVALFPSVCAGVWVEGTRRREVGWHT